MLRNAQKVNRKLLISSFEIQSLNLGVLGSRLQVELNHFGLKSLGAPTWCGGLKFGFQTIAGRPQRANEGSQRSSKT